MAGPDRLRRKLAIASWSAPREGTIHGKLTVDAAEALAWLDADWEKSKLAIRWLPTWLLRRVVWLTGWLASSLGLDIPALGVQRFAFGSAVITNVGMFGVDEAYVPPTPFARVPLWVLIGAVREVPTVRGGEVVATPQVTLTVTIDHRFIDGFQAGTLAAEFRRVFADPWSLDRPEPATPATYVDRPTEESA